MVSRLEAPSVQRGGDHLHPQGDAADVDLVELPRPLEDLRHHRARKALAQGKASAMSAWPAAEITAKNIARAALDGLEIDEIGLDQTDRNLLLAIIQKFDGGPVGLDTLAASTSEDPETIEDVYEPYLLQLGFLVRTPRGRIATRFAYKHLGLDAPHGGNGLGPGLWDKQVTVE